MGPHDTIKMDLDFGRNVAVVLNYISLLRLPFSYASLMRETCDRKWHLTISGILTKEEYSSF